MDEDLRNGLERFRLDLVQEILRVDKRFSDELETAKSAHPEGPTVEDAIEFAQLGGMRVGYANVLSAAFGINIYDAAHPLWGDEEQ